MREHAPQLCRQQTGSNDSGEEKGEHVVTSAADGVRFWSLRLSMIGARVEIWGFRRVGFGYEGSSRTSMSANPECTRVSEQQREPGFCR